MIAVPEEVMALLSDGAVHFFIVFLRTSAVVSVLPAFGERSVPMRVKLVLALAFTLIVAPAVPTVPAPTTLIEAAGIIAGEIIVGLAFGLAIRLFVLALQTAGSIAAQSTSLAQLLGGAAAEPIPAMGYILVVAGLALAVTLGLHVRAAELIVYTYTLFPVGALPEGQILAAWGLQQVSHAFRLAFTLAAPFVIASMIYNLTLGVINRAMPQLMVAFVGAPVTTFGGLLVLFFAAPTMLQAWHTALSAFMANPIGVAP